MAVALARLRGDLSPSLSYNRPILFLAGVHRFPPFAVLHELAPQILGHFQIITEIFMQQSCKYYLYKLSYVEKFLESLVRRRDRRREQQTCVLLRPKQKLLASERHELSDLQRCSNENFNVFFVSSCLVFGFRL